MNVSELNTNNSNPRQINEVKLEKLKASIKSFEKMLSLRPIVVDANNMVLGGNMRLRALQELGYKEIPDDWVKKADDLTEAEKREFIIKDNVGFGEWDWDVLANEWDADELNEWGLDTPDMWGGDAETGEDDFQEEPPVEPETVLGDLYELNGHRVHCADSTDSECVSKLMQNRLADVVVTDPPYNTGMTSNSDAKARLSHMFNDSFTAEEWADFLSSSFQNYSIFSKGECALYVFIDWRRVADMRDAVEEIADVKNVIVWDKEVHGLGSDYKSTYELCIVGKKGKPEINNRFGLDYQDIWRVRRGMGRNKDHATSKPIELIAKPIKHASKVDDIVLDLFLGSGTTLIAAEQLGRICYGQELDPAYCDVIVRRWVKYMRDNGKEYTVKRNGEDITSETWLTNG